ncbi:hypothetical protein [Simiduia aestuariiviva]|uniref:Uncharacterized protein n=1 Tax=Simiduia aestuariiviva TaxID=1510459 RepID=A0A839UMN4_9GAMM|nr:hypothetical protein [Simiduia aestuariiviva]MBB3166828.1 hypothetical protein [Simiduia aestuariiviva]
MQTYKNKPDVLELVVGKTFLTMVSIKNIEYPFGKSNEEYCYFNDVLIGEISGSAELGKVYYEGLNTKYEGRVVIKLTPMVSKNEYLLCPKYDDFNKALKTLLDMTNDFTLICEADCDQNKVKEESDLEKVLLQLKGFCIGEHYDCPTFIQRNEM